MSDMIWMNGEIIPASAARIGVEDRGFQFADGVYEVIRVYNGRTFTLPQHLARLHRSAAGIQLSVPIGAEQLSSEINRFIVRTGLKEGMIYLQLTRGVAPRNHIFPEEIRPTLLFYARPLPTAPGPGQGDGVKLLAVPDERWKRCWVKSIALLPNVLAKNQAIAAGADEAAFVEEGIVTECAASNLFAVIKDHVVTHPAGPKVLPGITRAVLLESARELGFVVEERPLLAEEAIAASELFITSTTREISWVCRWDDKTIASGRCGPVTVALHRALRQRIERETAN